MAKKTGSLISNLETTKKENDTLKNVVKNSTSSKREKKSVENMAINQKSSKRVSKSYYLNDQNTINLERYCSIMHIRTGEKLNPSTIVDNLISDYLKDKDLNI